MSGVVGAGIADLHAMNNIFPCYVKGTVVKGFGRGSKELGIPTANFPDDVVDALLPQLVCGVYCGFASVADGDVYPMVMSIGWNDFYKNTKRSAEVHILHVYENDFYGDEMKAVITHYIRPMRDFLCVDELIDAIRTDISQASSKLSTAPYTDHLSDKYFSQNTASGV